MSDRAVQLQLSLPIVRVAAGVLSVVAGLAFSGLAAANDQENRRAYYTPCGTFAYRGEHRLYQHAYDCDGARKKARYVLRHHKAPDGWKCSLGQLSAGYAACQNGRREFFLAPASGAARSAG